MIVAGRRLHAAQQRAALAVNRELVTSYWQLGRDILDRQARAGWGAGIVDCVSADLRAAFPAMRGFSRANLMYMRAFAEAWPDVGAIVQPACWTTSLEPQPRPRRRTSRSRGSVRMRSILVLAGRPRLAQIAKEAVLARGYGSASPFSGGVPVLHWGVAFDILVN